MAITGVTMSGADFKRFYNDENVWKNGMHHDDDDILLDGKQRDDEDLDKVDGGTIVEIRGGDVMNGDGDYVCSLDELAQRWVDEQTTVMLVVKVDKSKQEAVRAAIQSAGGIVQ